MEFIVYAALLVVVVGTFAYWLSALVDAIRRPSSDFEAIGRSKVLWVLGILIFELIGALAYSFIVRREFERPLGGNRMGRI